MNTSTRIVSFLAIIIGIGSFFWYIYGFPYSGASAVPNTINLNENDLPQNVGDSVQKDGYTITKELVPVGEQGTDAVRETIDLAKIPTPNYTAIPKKPANMPTESYAQIVEKMRPIIVDITKQIDENKKTGAQNLFTDGWLDIALYRNMLGDSAGAREIWIYLTKANPGLVQPYGNIANLYMVQQNFTEAEKWYLLALERMPKALQYYQDLADIYAAQKRTADYIAILKKGMAADPTSWNLHVVLGRYYSGVGDVTNADIQFNAAIALAKNAGNAAAVEAIEQEKK